MDRRVVALALITACASTLALGLVGGVLLARLGGRGRPAFAPAPGRGGPPPMGPPLEVMREQLDLSPAQEDAIALALDSTRREMRSVRESLRVRVERELTPAQRDRWRQWVRRGPPPRGRRFDGPPGRPDGPMDRRFPPGPPEEGEPR